MGSRGVVTLGDQIKPVEAHKYTARREAMFMHPSQGRVRSDPIRGILIGSDHPVRSDLKISEIRSDILYNMYRR